MWIDLADECVNNNCLVHNCQISTGLNFLLQITLEVIGQTESVSLSLGQSGAKVSVGQALTVRNREGSRQLLYGADSLLQVDSLSALGGLRTPTLTASMVSTALPPSNQGFRLNICNLTHLSLLHQDT